MFARVVLPVEKVERIVVSDKAVVKQAGSNERFVFVVDGDRVVHTKVEIGRRMDNKFEILNGLQPGQSVVVNGAARLVNGSKIEIKK